MKKYILILVVLLCTGCDKNQVLECNKKENDNGLSMEQNIKLEINNDKATRINIDVNFYLEGTYLEHKDIVEENVDEIVKEYQGYDGVQVSEVNNDSNILINLTVTYDKMVKKLENDTFNINRYQGQNTEAIKEQLEKENYSCKVSEIK